MRYGVFILAYIFSGTVASAGDGLILLPVELSPGIEAGVGEKFYAALSERLVKVSGVKLIERKLLKTIIDEKDLACAMTPTDALKAYSTVGQQLKAGVVLLPAISKSEHDMLLSLRRLDIDKQVTVACSVRRTRITDKFALQAGEMVAQIIGDKPETEPKALPVSADVLEQLRGDCMTASADKLFPSLWERTQAMSSTSDGAAAGLAGYYVGLLQLCQRAQSPPDGMVFIPGGQVSVKTSKGERYLWVEPFYIDRCETTVAQYTAFLAAREKAGDKLDGLRSITSAIEQYKKSELPITGVPQSAAIAYASTAGKQLPTALQWLRACGADGKRPYPCGESPDSANLTGGDDGFAVLAPASQPGKDVSPFGVAGLTGNVREWVSTAAAADLYATVSADAPQEPQAGPMVLVMGGSWRTGRAEAALGVMNKVRATEAFDDVGFRCVIPFFKRQCMSTTTQSRKEGR